MKKVIPILILSAAFLMMTLSAWAVPSKEEEAPWQYLSADVSPDAGPIAHYEPIEDMFDLVWYSDAGLTTGDNQLLGAEYAFGQFYITGGNLGGEPNQVYILDHDGNLVTQFDQWSSAGWGWRDLAFDGTYLYASDDLVVDAFDATGNPVPGMNINGPVNPARALAYDPVLDHFWAQSFTTPLYEFGRDGTVYWSGTNAATAYGAAWDEGAPDGPWLWIYSQTGTPQTTFHKFDPVGHAPTGFIYQQPLIPGSSDQIAGGAFMTEEWDPSLWLLGGMTQGTPDDMLFLLEMYPAGSGYRPAACQNFTATPDPGGALTCDLTWDLPTTTVNGQPIASYPITSVELERDGSPLVSLGPTATSYTDNVPAAAMYDYRVYAVNDSGNGIPSNASAWMGLDVPAGVENLVGEGVGTELIAELTWDNPTSGAHGGYFPPGSIDSYTINRYGPAPATFTLTGIATSYTDPVPVQGWYEYGVIAENASGPGPEVISNTFYVGPPEFEPIPYDWVEINPSVPGALPGENTGITGDDQNLGPFDIGFPFPFYGGATFTGIRVCSNGWLSFTSTSTAYSNVAIPTTAEPNNLVAPYWDDMYPPGGGTIWYYYDEANSRFIVEFYQVMSYSSPRTPQTFEAILYPDGNIDYMYNLVQAPCINNNTVGIENSTGTVGVQCTYNGSGPIEPAPMTGIRIYSVSPPPPDMEITLVPFTYPIQIPATGGSFEYYGFVTNNEAEAIDVDLWIDAQLPDGSMTGALMGPFGATLDPGTIGWHRIQNVPGSAPVGVYQYYAKGGIYPEGIWAMDVIDFEKLSTGDGPWIGDWANWGDLIGDEAGMAAQALPQTFALDQAHPNPFNPTTTIGFDLPEAAKVTLNVYDISGRLVARLVDGWRDAGTHQAIFDGSNLASGVYIVNLTAGHFNATGKMVLMK